MKFIMIIAILFIFVSCGDSEYAKQYEQKEKQKLEEFQTLSFPVKVVSSSKGKLHMFVGKPLTGLTNGQVINTNF
jgi:hypothetical protein